MTVSDQKQRDQALDISQSHIVQAPAGSGKTGVLTLRILKLLLIVEQPEEILAITFTKKAAAEMKVRVMEALELALGGAVPDNDYDRQFYDLGVKVIERDTRRNWCLLQNQNRLRMLTIDSFCSSIVRSRPLSSGLGVAYGIADDPEELYREAALELLNSLDSEDELGRALNRVLETLDNQFGKLTALVSQMLAQRDHWLQDITNVHGNLELFKSLLESSLDKLNAEALAQIEDLFDYDFFPELDSISIYAKNQLNNQKIDHSLLLAEESSTAHLKEQLKLLLTKDLKPRSRLDKNSGFPTGANRAEKEEAKLYKDRAKALIDQVIRSGDPGLAAIREFLLLPAATLADEQWQLLEDLIHIMRFASAHLKLVFQSKRSVDFSEVALAALSALGSADEPTDLTLIFDSTLNHILVDEFQDTSLLQVELLDRLTAGWSPGESRSLFLVGDPMQSIYAFRKAEVGLFLRLWNQERLGSVPLNPLLLSTNFRSSETIIRWVNDMFAWVFPQAPDIRKGAVQYSPSVANRVCQAEDTAEIHLFQYGEDQKEIAAKEEAAWIADAIQRSTPSDSIAILVRGKSHVVNLIPELKSRDIAYQAVDIESLSQSQVISDLLSAARAYLSPNDKTAWYGLLRGPWCGLDLNELQVVADTDNSPWQAIRVIATKSSHHSELSEPSFKGVKHLHDIFSNAYANRHRDPWCNTVENLILALGIPATAQNQTQLDSIDLFLDVLHAIEPIADVPDFGLLRKKLDDLFVPPEVYASDRQVVQIMSMHKSKGLEFDYVFLPQLQRGARAEGKPLVLLDKQTATMSDMQELFLAPFDKRSDKDEMTVYGYLRRLQTERLANEAARLLYVACTRAKKRLYLSGLVELQDEIRPPSGQSLLARLFPHYRSFPYFLHAVSSADELTAPIVFRRPNAEFFSQLSPDDSLNVYMAPESAISQSDNELEQEDNDSHRRLAGIFTHRLLELMAKTPSLFGELDPDTNQAAWRRELIRMGLFEPDLSAATSIVVRAIKAIQSSENGKWLFSATREEDYAEYGLVYSLNDDPYRNLIIDRTFVEGGTRYIIDYKLSEPSGDLAEFLSSEVQQYSEQLNRYANAMNALSPMPTKLYLYFPLIDCLQEVAPPCQ